MPGFKARQTVRRPLDSVDQLSREPGRERRSEIARANRIAGTQPLRHELSGLQVRKPPRSVPLSLIRTLSSPAYRWQPSKEYRRRREEMDAANRHVRACADAPRALPPILSYAEDTDVQPMRLQPMLHRSEQVENMPPLPASGRDLSDLDRQAHRDSPPVIGPRVSETDPDYLLTERPLLPHHYRRFLRTSPYPRFLAAAVACVLAACSALWLVNIQDARADAQRDLGTVRARFRTEVAHARAFGVDPGALHRATTRAHRLERLPVSSDLLPGKADLVRFHAQIQGYRALVSALHGLERRAQRFWSWRVSESYADLATAARDANAAGLRVGVPVIPACTTPRCDRATVARGVAQARWLHETVATLRVYAADVATAPNPEAVAGSLIQQARRLQTVLASASVPLPVSRLALPATAPETTAMVGALAHLDVDALQRALQCAPQPRRGCAAGRGVPPL